MVEVFRTEDLELSFSFGKQSDYEGTMEINWRNRNTYDWVLENIALPVIDDLSLNDLNNLFSSLKIDTGLKSHVLCLLSHSPLNDPNFIHRFFYDYTDYYFVSISSSSDRVLLTSKKRVERICEKWCRRSKELAYLGVGYISDGFYGIYFDCRKENMKEYVLVNKDGFLQTFNIDEYKNLFHKPSELRAIIDYLVKELEDTKKRSGSWG